MTSAFADATAVTQVGLDRYSAEIDAVWNLRPLPQGGVVTALALRAMTARLDDPTQQLRTMHTTFAAKVTDGPVEVEVELLRHGRTMSQLRAEVRNVGADRGHLTTAIFGAPREGFEFTDEEPPPGIPLPHQATSFREPPPPGVEGIPPTPFWMDMVDGRSALGHPPWEDYEPGRAERASWLRFEDPPFHDDGTIDPLSLVVLIDTMPGAASEKLGRTDQLWFAPSVDLTVHLLDDCRSSWVLAHSTARHAGGGYASADNALWDCGEDGTDEPRLVAHATQVFLFSFLD